MNALSRSHLPCLVLTLLAYASVLPTVGFTVGPAHRGHEPSRTTVVRWDAEHASRTLDAVLAALPVHEDPSVSRRQNFGAFGHIGVSRSAASYRDLFEFAEELASDKHFRELVVRHVSQVDCGVQFVYTGVNVKDSMIPDLIRRFRQRFGRNSIVSINISGVTTSEPGARALGIVTFRPLE